MQLVQEKLLRQHGILWRHLKIDMVRTNETDRLSCTSFRLRSLHDIDLTLSLSHIQEFNSVEAIKSAVQYGLGAAFVSSAAIVKEMELGLFRRLDISGVRLVRTLTLVSTLVDHNSTVIRKIEHICGAANRARMHITHQRPCYWQSCTICRVQRVHPGVAQVSSPTREPSFAAQKFMSDMFATPGPRACNGSSGTSSGSSNGNSCTPPPVLFRNAVPAPRPWEQRAHRTPSDPSSQREIIPLLEDESGPEKK